MRSFLTAALVLAPALASAFVVPSVVNDQGWEDERTVPDHSFALVGFNIPPSDSSSPDDRTHQALAFRVDVLPSEGACGYGNITINRQVLPQTLDGDVLTGKGAITTKHKSDIVGSWALRCIKVNNQPDAQFLKLVIESVDGEVIDPVGFTVLFRQTGAPEIVKISTDLSLPETVAANPDPEVLSLAGENVNIPQYSVEDDMAELDWMYAQLHELKLMIAEKQQAIAAHAYDHSDYFEEDIKDCGSLKCVVAAVVHKVRYAAHEVYGKIAGQDDIDILDEESGHFPKTPFKKPHWPKLPKNPFHHGRGKHSNHTCGPPRNETGNHTHPHPHPPHWRKPHHFLPICRLPPHHKPPHHKPPHHGPPPPHGPPPHGPPPHGPPPHGPPPHGTPPHGKQHEDHPPAPPPHQQDLMHEAQGDDQTPPPPHIPGQNHDGLDDDDDDERRPPPPHRHSNLGRLLKLVKFGVIGFIFAFLLLALHRRACTPEKRVAHKARREERRRRRAFRRAAHQHTIGRFLSRMSWKRSGDESTADYEEKRTQLLAESGDDMSTTMTDEITQFGNAVSVVDDMVSAEEGRVRTVAYVHGRQPEPTPVSAGEEGALSCGYDIGSQVGDGEELPAYEDNDGSEMSSMVADGFRYTPGSSEYTPQQSASGSVSDILGPDTKN